MITALDRRIGRLERVMRPRPVSPMAAVSAPALMALAAMLRARIDGAPMPALPPDIDTELTDALPRILAWHGMAA